MYKNTTYLAKPYNLAQPFPLKVISRYLMPLFQITITNIKPNLYPQNKRAELFKRGIFEKTRQPKNFNKFLCIHANVSSNCRRNKLINSKRDTLLQYMNAVQKQGYGMTVILSKVNYYVPDSQLLNQIKKVVQLQPQKIIYQNRQKNSLTKNQDLSKVSIFDVLNDFNVQKWNQYLKYQFYSKNSRNLRLIQLENSYLQVSISNFYRIKFSGNGSALYQDLRDFDKVLSKFNFIRFFMTNQMNNAMRSQKNCEAFIKNLKWRTKQAEDYLLFLIRNNSWQRFCITIQNFTMLYEKYVLSKQKTAF